MLIGITDLQKTLYRFYAATTRLKDAYQTAGPVFEDSSPIPLCERQYNLTDARLVVRAAQVCDADLKADISELRAAATSLIFDGDASCTS